MLFEFGYLLVGIALPKLVPSSELVRLGFASCLDIVACPNSTGEVCFFSLVVPWLVYCFLLDCPIGSSLIRVLFSFRLSGVNLCLSDDGSYSFCFLHNFLIDSFEWCVNCDSSLCVSIDGWFSWMLNFQEFASIFGFILNRFNLLLKSLISQHSMKLKL